MKNWIIVATFLCLWISTMFSSEIQSYLAYALILTFGVLHGANDLSIIKYKSAKNGIKMGFYKVLGLYVFTVLVIIGLFFIYPPLALFLFIVLSGFHFGEQHFKKYVLEKSILFVPFYLFYGLTILFMIFYFKINSVKYIFNDIVGYNFSNGFFANVLIISFFGFLTSLLYLFYKKKIRLNLVEELFYLLVLLIVFNTADLLWGFCIYFILWHSLPSLRDQMQLLYGNTSKIGFREYLKSSWLYWLASMFGIVLCYYFFRNDSQYLTSILIYFLAAITFPHVIVMARLEED